MSLSRRKGYRDDVRERSLRPTLALHAVQVRVLYIREERSFAEFILSEIEGLRMTF
jgi:hypothetical protein